jgi:hypothetical protein
MQKPLISLIAMLGVATPAVAQAPPVQPVHIRGTIVSSSSGSIVVTTGSSAETITFSPRTRLLGIIDSSLDRVVPGDFIGTTVVPKRDGSLEALEVHIFPPALKGTGEGYRPWDKQRKSMMANATVGNVERPRSMMANATVARMGSGGGNRTVQLVYKGGTKTVILPPDIPVVTFVPGTKALFVSGAHVFVIAARTSSGLVARAITVGEHGVVPPM